MESNILDALPTIHGILIGIGTAFFSGFAILAYQKLQESKDKLERVLSEVANYRPASRYIHGECIGSLFTNDGHLDWDEGTRLIYESRVPFFRQDNYTNRGLSDVSDDEQVRTTVLKLCTLLSQIFCTYPFNGESVRLNNDLYERIEAHKSKPFTVARLKKIRERLDFLCSSWHIDSAKIIALARRCRELEAKNATVRGDKTQGNASNKDYEKFIRESFEFAIDYGEKIYPILSEHLDSHRFFVERFNFIRTTKIAFEIIAFIFVFGVLAPIILLGLAADKGLVWPLCLPYVLLLLTTAPYVVVWFFLFGKIRNLKLE